MPYEFHKAFFLIKNEVVKSIFQIQIPNKRLVIPLQNGNNYKKERFKITSTRRT